MKNFYCCTKERRGGKPVSGKCINRASLSKISVRSIYALFTYKKWCFSSSIYSFCSSILAPYTLTPHSRAGRFPRISLICVGDRCHITTQHPPGCSQQSSTHATQPPPRRCGGPYSVLAPFPLLWVGIRDRAVGCGSDNGISIISTREDLV